MSLNWTELLELRPVECSLPGLPKLLGRREAFVKKRDSGSQWRWRNYHIEHNQQRELCTQAHFWSRKLLKKSVNPKKPNFTQEGLELSPYDIVLSFEWKSNIKMFYWRFKGFLEVFGHSKQSWPTRLFCFPHVPFPGHPHMIRFVSAYPVLRWHRTRSGKLDVHVSRVILSVKHSR